MLHLSKGNEKLHVPLESYCPQKKTSNNLTRQMPHNENHMQQTIETDQLQAQDSNSGKTQPTFRTTHLSASVKKQLLEVLNEHAEAFHTPDSNLTCSTEVECVIKTTDNIPVHQKIYMYPRAYAEEVNNQINKLLQDGIIRPSRSAWTSPVWIVPKKSDASGENRKR